MPRALRTVRARITLVAAGAFAIAFTLAAFTLVRVVDIRVHDQARRVGKIALEYTVQQLERRESLSDITSQLQPSVIVQEYDSTGVRLDELNTHSFAIFESNHIVGYSLDQSAYSIFKQPVTFDGPFKTTGWVVVATSLESANRSVETLRRALWIAIPWLIFLVAAVVWWLVGRALRPVEQIRGEVESITSRTIDRRVAVPDTDDEVARLAETMNAMLDRLEGAQLRQREFVSDASHELRSPVSSMRTELEVALAHPETTDWPAMAQRVLGEHDRLEHLVDDLLQLARLDEGRPLRVEDVDLDDLVLNEAAHARRLPVRTSAVSAGRVRGEPRVLEQVVRNLLDNAARHGDSQVAVGVHQNNGHVVLTVDDDGPGVAPIERVRIFERFTRGDTGRARYDGGTGLGLALVRRVVAAHGGSIVCEESPLGGARFEVSLPAT